MAEHDQAGGEATTEKRQSARGETHRVELTRGRLAHARRFAESRATIPQLESTETVELSRLRSNDYDLVAAIVSLTARTLLDHPRLNAAWRDGGIEEYSRRNLAVVASAPEGVAAPTIFDADGKDAASIERELAELTRAARNGELRAPQTAGATFTVQPPVGARSLAAAVSGGQAATLVIGEPRPAALPMRGAAAIVEAAELHLSCDGRAVLPIEAGAFLSDLRRRIEG